MSQGGGISSNHCAPLGTYSVEAVPMGDTHDCKQTHVQKLRIS